MRRVNHLFEAIAERDNLRLAVSKALRGKRSKGDARAFVVRLDEELDGLRSELLQGDVGLGEYHQFKVFDPNERLITALCFRERILHHAILNVCEPVFERRLIADSFACRRGKGQFAALHRARQFAGRHGFFLKLDVRKHFESIPHANLVARLERLFKDRRLLALLRRNIAGHEAAPGRGLPIGSLTSQHFANFSMGWTDRFVKEVLRVEGYVRYMDDCALRADTPRRLREHLAALASFLRTDLGLALKPRPYINRTAHGMDFLGCRVFPGHLTLNRRSRVRFRRKLRALEVALQYRATAL